MPGTATTDEGSRAYIVLAFSATLLLSALLLFSVQPMVAKMLLPVLGGAPAIWAVSLCFFQMLLLLGYAYAHLLGRVGGRWGPAIHVALLLAAFLTLPVALPAAREPPAEGVQLWLLTVLAGMVGLPFLVVSATAPLLQAWFGRIGHRRSGDPYFLYAASNAGSLVALLAYPPLIEPLLTLSSQSRVWMWGFLLLAACIAGCAWIMVGQEPDTGLLSDENDSSAAAPVAWGARAGWVLLSLVPSGLLVAYTTYLTTDLASAPLLWVVPLALYLATFIVVFRERSLLSDRVLLMLQPVAVAGAVAANEWTGDYSWAVSALLGLVAFVITCLVCHSQLYALRPGRRHLTGYYLALSLGGVLGGAFAALVAPLVFTGTWEFPLLLALGMFCRPALWRKLQTWRAAAALGAAMAAGAGALGLLAFLLGRDVLTASSDLRLDVVCGIAVLLVLLSAAGWPRAAASAAIAMVLAMIVLPSAAVPVYVTRDFFGTHRVIETASGNYRMLLHGTTVHGIQLNQSGTAALSRMIPLAYYHPSGPLGMGLELARTAAGEGPLRVGIIGLGTGAMACYAKPGDRWRFYEIDPAVARIATTPSLFRYIARCLPEPDIVLGDARLTIAREPDRSLDFLLVDAFSSDAIPVHLLTVEALALYLRKLSDRGLLVLHISNQNLDLAPVIESNVAALDGVSAVYAEGKRAGGALASQAVLISRDPEMLSPVLGWHHARQLDKPAVRPWTDDYSDILSAAWRRYRSKLRSATR
jgi:hypothetical protein